MSSNLPPTVQLHHQFCFLSPRDEHNRISLDLGESVVMVPFMPSVNPSKEELTANLVARYGGPPASWRLQSTRLGFLVKYPDWLMPDQLLHDSYLWERDLGLQVLPWDCLDQSNNLPPRNRTLVSIRDFPVDHWHPTYFRLATASWGVMVGIAPENLSGDDKVVLKLLIDIHDRKLVPFFLFVGHQGRWTKCEIELEGRLIPEYLRSPPPPSSSTGGGQSEEDDDVAQPPFDTPPSISLWRRAGFRLPIPPIDPNRRLAPAAEQGSEGFQPQTGLDAQDTYAPKSSTTWCRGAFHTPSPRARNGKGFGPEVYTVTSSIRLPHKGQNRNIWNGQNRTPEKEEKRRDPASLQENNDVFPIKPNVPRTCGGHAPIVGMHAFINPKDDKLRCGIGYHNKDVHNSILGPPPGFEAKKPNIFYSKLATLNPLSTSPILTKGGWPKDPLPVISCVAKHSLPYTLSNLPPFSLSSLNLSYPNHIYNQSPKDRMADMRQEDEALIRQFVGLHTGEELLPSVKIPQRATTSTSWELCLLAKVISDRTTPDHAFSMLMKRVWGVDPATVIRPITRNCYLIEFVNEEERRKVSLGGPWTYRGDLIATRHVASHADLKPEHIALAHLWVQFFGLPVNSLTEEGIDIVASEVGTPVSPPVDGFINGKSFVKVKILVDLAVPVKDRVTFDHPTLGTLTAYCVYEKVSRICRFCGELGHEVHSCPTRARVAALMQEENYRAQFNASDVLTPKRGLWITDPGHLPRAQVANKAQDDIRSTGAKRNFSNSGQNRAYQNRSGLVTVPVVFGENAAAQPHESNSPSSPSSQPLKRPRPAGQVPPAQDI